MRCVLQSSLATIVLTACAPARVTPDVVAKAEVVPNYRQFIGEIEGQWWGFSVTAADLVGTPRWEDPARTPPPLSVADAIREAASEVPRYVTDASKWHVDSVALYSLGKERLWFYVVSYSIDGATTATRIPIPVLMSGRVVAGRKRNPPGR